MLSVVMRKLMPAFMLFLSGAVAAAQQPESGEQQIVMGHVQALESLATADFDSAIAAFERDRFADAYKSASSADARRAMLAQIRDIVAKAGGISVEKTAAGVAVQFEGPGFVRIVALDIEPTAPYRITAMGFAEPPPDIAITRETLASAVDAYMAEGDKAGLVFVALDGEPVLQKAYGMANAELGTPITENTIFGIGSRPIDFTIAAIYLLEKQGKLARSDTLADHFPDVPADRAGMTIAQMMSGKSGFPDFPAQDGDWDADLAWIDRAEFERRTMAVPMLFAPGEGEAHSHWAFGVLAVIVERVSGQSYEDFTRAHFFDPAGMARTGNYGDRRDLALGDFAVGGGKQVGLPNIPPNWGPTSWLVKGSGGMYSTLGDLRRFYELVTREDVLGADGAAHFRSDSVQIDGSERGFELFSANERDRRDEAWIFLSKHPGPGSLRPIIRPLVRLLRGE